MALDNREFKFFDVPNRMNVLLALKLFDSDNNADFYKRSLLLRILSSETDFPGDLIFVDRKGRRKAFKLDFKSRAALAA